MPVDAASQRARNEDWFWLAGVVALASVLRFLNLGTWSFWADEVFTLRDARAFPSTLTMNPLPYACVAACIKVFGVSEWSARLAPALVGVACAPLAHWAGRRLLSRWTGRAASLLVALSPWHVFWSQNARHYVFTFAFGLVALVAFYEATRDGSARWSLAALAATAAVALSHTPAAAFVLGPGAYCAAMALRERGWLMQPRRLAAVGVYFAPILAVGIVVLATPGLRGGLVSGWGRNAWARSIPYIAMTYAHGVTLPVLAAAAVGAWGVRPLSTGHVLTLCGLAVPASFFVAASLVQNVPGYYLFFTSACAILLAAKAAAWAVAANPKAGVFALAVLSAALLGQNVVYHMAEQGGRPPWREALRQLRDAASEGAIVYMPLPDIGQHYLEDEAPDAPEVRRLTAQHIARATPMASDAAAPVYVVVDMRSMETLDASGAFMRWLSSAGVRVARAAGHARGSDRTIEGYRLVTP